MIVIVLKVLIGLCHADHHTKEMFVKVFKILHEVFKCKYKSLNTNTQNSI